MYTPRRLARDGGKKVSREDIFETFLEIRLFLKPNLGRSPNKTEYYVSIGVVKHHSLILKLLVNQWLDRVSNPIVQEVENVIVPNHKTIAPQSDASDIRQRHSVECDIKHD